MIGIFSPPSPPSSNTPATATPTVDLVISATALAQHNPNLTALASTPTPTSKPTATPTLKPLLRATPKPKPQPTPTVHTSINGNPWGYDFNLGNLIYTPPSGFCNYFNCIATFYAPDDPGDGYIVECQDGTFSQSGGESDLSADHTKIYAKAGHRPFARTRMGPTRSLASATARGPFFHSSP